MDDHLLDRIERDIELCFMLCQDEEEKGNDIVGSMNYESARELIKCYNKLSKLYYGNDSYCLGNVSVQYKIYKELHGGN